MQQQLAYSMSAASEVEDDSSEDIDKIYKWQTIPSSNKRKVCKSPIGNEAKKQNISSDQPSTSAAATNRYSLLDNGNQQQQEEPSNNANVTPKPPPIFIPGVTNIMNMIESFVTIIPRDDFSYKSQRNDEVKVMVSTIESYRKLMKYLENGKINYHTYQIRQERSYRVVLKGIHYTTPVLDIKAELLSLGFDVRNVHNVKRSKTKHPLSMFYIDLDPKPNNSEIYNVKRLCDAVVNVEPPNKVTDFVQCFRCQQYGHTQRYCKKAFRCVKCAMDHPTAECKKQQTTPPKCVHCLESHTANYKGCAVYQNLLSRRLNNNHSENRRFAPNVQQQNVFNSTNPNVMYADVLKDQNSARDSNLFAKIEHMLSKQLELTNNLLNMMSLLVSKLCK